VLSRPLADSFAVGQRQKAWSNWLTVSKVMSSELFSTVIEVKVAKTVRLWKFGFCRDMSLDLGVIDVLHREWEG
jgi:hypothetical protein